MDPNATLRRIRELIESTSGFDRSSEGDELLESFQALDNWLSSGGFKPDDWKSPLER